MNVEDFIQMAGFFGNESFNFENIVKIFKLKELFDRYENFEVGALSGETDKRKKLLMSVRNEVDVHKQKKIDLLIKLTEVKKMFEEIKKEEVKGIGL